MPVTRRGTVLTVGGLSRGPKASSTRPGRSRVDEAASNVRVLDLVPLCLGQLDLRWPRMGIVTDRQTEQGRTVFECASPMGEVPRPVRERRGVTESVRVGGFDTCGVVVLAGLGEFPFDDKIPPVRVAA